MKRKTKTVLLLSAIGVLLIFKLVNLSFEGKTFSSNIVTYSAVIPDSEESNSSPEPFNKPYKIIFHGLSDINSSAEFTNDYIIDVYVEEETSIGLFIYMPFYKPIAIRSKGTYKWINPLIASGSTDPMTSENFEMDAKLCIGGFCSIKKARQQSLELKSTTIQNHIKTIIAKNLNPPENN
jgi:hypothetical protein